MTSRMAGQTLNDRILAAKHSLAGQGLAKSVCKATTEEMIGPKKKHLDYLVHCTNEPNVSIPQLANLLIERSQNTNWLVVYKALITVHHMMCYGNERFTQYLASSNSTFQLSNFLDKGGVQGGLSARIGYDMSPFIRRYSRYLNEKALSYRTIAFDFCKVKRGKEDGMLRTMNADKLLKTLPTLQSQLDALLEFDCSANDLTNGVINMCFMLLFRDLIRLFACYNDGIINLLEKYFDMNKKQCRDALDIYKKFLIRMDRVAEFLKVAENVGIDKGDIPDLTKAPSSLLEALEQHLQYVEGKVKPSSNTTPQSASNQKNVRSGVSALSSTSSSFGTVVANGRIDAQANGIEESLKLKILAEEEAAINQFKSKVQHSHSTANNPFLSSTTNTTASSQSTPMDDLFASEPVLVTAQPKASDDLLQLGNPFADAFPQPMQAVYQPQSSTNLWMTNGNGYANVQPSPVNGTFVSESNFNVVFGNDTNTADESIGPQSFNPFLVDDPIPSLLLDSDSPTHNSTKPIQDVLNFFQKVDNAKENEMLVLSMSYEKVVDVASDNKTANVSHNENSLEKSDNIKSVLVDDYVSSSNIRKSCDIKKSTPPPRPPPPNPPVKNFQELDHNFCNLVRDRPIISTFSSDNHPVYHLTIQDSSCPCVDNNIIPSVFTANEELPVLSQSIEFNSLGDVLQPTSLQARQQATSQQSSNNNNNPQSSSALLTGDLESSLASLAENLSINNRPPPVTSVQWNSPKNGSKVGSSWTLQPTSATMGAGYKPMNQAMVSTQATAMQPQLFQTVQPAVGIRPMAVNPALIQQRPGMTPTPAGSMMNQQSLLFH